ncbi:MAG TPA: chemotaxis protein CheA [Nocardioides sp.]|nr:chemotaxis protein CheA [Nocardioides sp.]
MDDDAEIVAEFLVESHENLDQLDRDLVALEQDPTSRDLLSSVFRAIHTIKGTSGFLAFGRLEQLTHVGENLLARLRDGQLQLDSELAGTLLRLVDTVRDLLASIERTGTDTDPAVSAEAVAAELERALSGPPADAVPAEIEAAEAAPVADEPVAAEPEPEPAPETPDEAGAPSIVDATVRVDVELLDSLVQMVGELVLTRNQILQRCDDSADVELVRASQRLDLVASELQEGVMRTRMQPIGQVWSKMPRVVRDLAHQLGREVDLRMEGHDTELDRSLLEALKGPLTHLVRNALDHGIEPPEERAAAGKPPAGSLCLRAYHESGQVVVEIADDGRGMDPVRIGEIALARGVVTPETLRRMEPRELLDLVFRPGFSTAATITNVSGRGVGMDVVRTNIDRIGGSVDLVSSPGAGTTVRVRIPLTLAIIPALVVGERGERYAIPQANLVELVRLDGDDLAQDLEIVAGAPVLRLRGRLLPLVHLGEALGRPRTEDGAITVVVVQADESRFGLCVSEVHDTQEIVVKPIGRQLRGLPMYAGATIMGDGRVALILDVAGLAPPPSAVVAEEAAGTAQAATDTVSLLVLESMPGHRAALPLGSVSRLEEFPASAIERTGRTEVVQYRDGILPLLRLGTLVGLDESVVPREPDARVSVVVHDGPYGLVGIVIEKVLDVVEQQCVPTDVGRRAGVLGSAVVQGRVTELIDLDAVVGNLAVLAGVA